MVSLNSILCLFFLTFTSTLCFPTKLQLSFDDGNDKKSEMSMYRLPTATKPVSYTLEIIPDLVNFTFKGEVNIEIFVNDAVNQIYLNSKYLKIALVEVMKSEKLLQSTFKEQKENEILEITVKSTLVKGEKYNVKVQFGSVLHDAMIGFYRSSYVVDEEVKWLAATQFEATYARMAFPCYDDPSYKTPFTISIGRPSKLHSISNMPRVHSTPPNPLTDIVMDIFETSPAMPTYLVAFIVSEFDSLNNLKQTFNVWARQNAISQGTYIFNEGPKLLSAMERYTNIKYSMPKMDLVAIPDFDMGAMENWGLTTYREKYILFDSTLGSERNKELITSIVAHEFSHQWFGNLVTPTWWSYTWLNEAFARYFQYYITDELHTDWRMKEMFVVQQVQTALFDDGVIYYHAMTHHVKTPDEINGNFDRITYNKGASVVRMLEHIVTSSVFKKALNVYLEKGKKEGGSVYPKILWNAFHQKVQDEKIKLPVDISIIMTRWTDNQGYPLITVNRKENNDIVIVQETYNSSRAFKETPKQEWIVPITYTIQSRPQFQNTQPAKWSFNKMDLVLDNVPEMDWIIVNLQQTGYYRVNYDPEIWDLITQQLENDHEVIHVLNRAQLIDDSFSLAIDGYLDYKIALVLGKYLDHETDVLPWLSMINKLNYLNSQYMSSDINDGIREYAVQRLKHIYDLIGLDEKPFDDHALLIARPQIAAAACEFGYQRCIDRTLMVYNDYKNRLYKLSPNSKQIVLCTVLGQSESNEIWDNIWKYYRKSNVASEQEVLIYSLGCALNRTQLITYLNKLIDDNDKDIRLQDVHIVLQSIFSRARGVIAGLRFIQETLPRVNSMSVRSEEVFYGIIRSLRLKIKSFIQLRMLSRILKNAEDMLKDSKHSRMIDGLKQALSLGYLEMQYNSKRMNNIFGALRHVGAVAENPMEKLLNSSPSFKSLIYLYIPMAIVTMMLQNFYKNW